MITNLIRQWFERHVNKIGFSAGLDQRLLIGVLLLISGVAAQAADAVVSWTSVTDSRVLGYEVHYGTQSTRYDTVINTSTNTVTVHGLEPGNIYYFAVRAIGAYPELTSDFSREESAAIPGNRPTAAFRVQESTGYAPFLVRFQDASTGAIAEWNWDFGDGSSSSLQSPEHTYQEPDNYKVVLTVSGPSGTAENSDTIRVLPGRPVANFTPSATSGTAPLTVSFTNNSTGPIDSYLWTFNDGGEPSVAESPVRRFEQPGDYQVVLTVTGPGGSSESAATIRVRAAPPAASFTPSTTSGTAPLTVSFTNNSTGPIDSYLWTFNDGGEASVAKSPVRRFEQPGDYQVVLTVTGPGGSSESAATISVRAAPPVVNLTVETGELTVGSAWQWVKLNKSFNDPVVVAGPLGFNDAAPALVRIDGVTATGFWIRVQEWDYLDDVHAPEAVSYLAIERGRHQLPGGAWVEAGRMTASGRALWDLKGYEQSFAKIPVILATVASNTDPRAVTIRLRNVNLSSFALRLQQQETMPNSHGSEMINYVAWEPSDGTVDGLRFKVARTGRVVSHNPFTLRFGTYDRRPTFLASMQTNSGAEPSALRVTNLGTSSVNVWVQEEQSKDAEVMHPTEAIGWAVFR